MPASPTLVVATMEGVRVDRTEARKKAPKAHAHTIALSLGQLAEAARAPVERRARLVRRAVAQAIEADAEEGELEQLFDDLDERLADREDDDDFLDRPVSELVARICKDLGVSVDWSLWEDEAWAIEEAAARKPALSGEAPGPDTTHDPPPSTHLRPDGAPSWLSG
jgi:hypothetical protein